MGYGPRLSYYSRETALRSLMVRNGRPRNSKLPRGLPLIPPGWGKSRHRIGPDRFGRLTELPGIAVARRRSAR
jgi:hypothetical protein